MSSEGRGTGQEGSEGKTGERRQSIQEEPWVKFDPTHQHYRHGTHCRNHGKEDGYQSVTTTFLITWQRTSKQLFVMEVQR